MRQVIQISGNYALCNDGTMWRFEVIDTSDERGKSSITNWYQIETPEDWMLQFDDTDKLQSSK